MNDVKFMDSTKHVNLVELVKSEQCETLDRQKLPCIDFVVGAASVSTLQCCIITAISGNNSSSRTTPEQEGFLSTFMCWPSMYERTKIYAHTDDRIRV